MIDHISLRVTDLDRSVAFYKAALAPIGYTVMAEYPGVVGMGAGVPDLWITKTDKAINEAHVGFKGTRAQVDAFHAAAIAAGATDNGSPGPREIYSPTYYGAFVLDFDGNNIEVCSQESAVVAKARSAVKAVKKAVKKAVAKVKAKPAVKKAVAKAKKAAPKKAAPKKAAPKAKAKGKKKR